MPKENRASQFYIRFNREYQSKIHTKSIAEISTYFSIPIAVLQYAFERGKFAYKKKLDCTNEKINTNEYHAWSRVYRFVLNVVDIRAERIKKCRIDNDLIKISMKQLDIQSPV